ncbi:hypothetical protein [Curtobacterium sp. NPDC089689]|uniref:hypothetical protein n=1 Tax=Curtobacterium sp. NPDC089689 TaxID=3363968 RepID=UPI00382E73A9
MTRNRLSMLLAVASMVIVALAGFFFGVQPQLAQAAADREQQVGVDATNRTTASELARLKERAKSLPKLEAELATLTDSVPASASMSKFYASVDAVAARSGVKVSAITTADALAYTQPTSTTATAPGTDSTASPEASATATPDAEATGGASPSPTASTVTDPRITPANFSAIPVTVSVDGSFDQALAFVGGMQDGPRLFLVNAVSSTAAQSTTGGSDSGSSDATTWTFGGYVYVLSDEDSTAADKG